jgi:murein DD-endopeptidase MepM/ murein hydrolase activator NlpD
MKPHLGVDFADKIGTPVSATAVGIVIFAGKEKGFGKVVRVSHGYGFTTMYAHLDNILVREGQNVAKGQQIGTLGNTGRSIGPHLHYEIIKDEEAVDPELYF